MELHEIVETSARVAAISGRRAKVELLASCLARAADWVEAAVGLLSGAPRQGKIGIGYAALREARQVSPAATPTLTLAEIDAALDRLLEVRGKGTAAARARLLHELFAHATADEQDFLVRLLLGELRQGALEGLMIEAIAKASALPVDDVRRAVMMAGDTGTVAKAALGEGQAGLARFAIQLFRPIKPMLAQPADDLADALGTLGRAAFEYKLDGARVQAHKAGDEVRVFSRRLNEVTAAVPEIVEAVQGLPVREAILDGEAIALRPDGWPQPFQITMRRFGRKLDVAAMRQSLPLQSFFFDALALEGIPLIDRPAGERFAALRDACAGNSAHPAHGDRSRGRGDGVREPSACRRARGRDGQGAGGALRGRRPRQELAQAQDRDHAGSGGPRRGVGQRSAPGLAVKSAPGRPRPGARRLRHARQDVQRPDRSDAHLANRAVAGP